MIALLMTAALADCPTKPERTTLELTSSLEAAETSYQNADVDGFLAAAGSMDAVIPCIGEVIPRSLVARVHRTFGMRAFVSRNNEQASKAFSGARNIEPMFAFPPEMVPTQHPMAKLYAEADDTGTTSPIERPAQGSFLFDGRRTLDRPYTRVSLLQQVEDDEVLGTWYLWPKDPMPDYAVWTPDTAKASKGFGVSKVLLIGAGAAAVIAGGTYAAAGANRSTYLDAPVEHKDALRSRTNALVVTSAGVGVVAAGLGATAVVMGQW
jgi:hypothetical protein